MSRYIDSSGNKRAVQRWVKTSSGILACETWQGSGPPGTYRDLSCWPFAADDPFNIGIGNNAVWSSGSSPIDPFVSGLATGNVNGAQQHPSYAIPVYDASAPSPLQTVTTGQGTFSFRVPTGANPASGTDHHMTCVQAKSGATYEMYGMYGVTKTAGAAPNTYTAEDCTGPHDLSQYSTAYDGRASSILRMAGEIRVYDITQRKSIDHAIAVAMPPSSMNPAGPVWPATTQDGNAATSYTGGPNAARMGMIFGIPASVNLSTLGLNAGGLMLATALQRYGCLVIDTAEVLAFVAEDEYDEGNDTAAFTTAVAQMQSDMTIIVPQLRVLLNQQTSQSALSASAGWGTGSTGSLAPTAPSYA